MIHRFASAAAVALLPAPAMSAPRPRTASRGPRSAAPIRSARSTSWRSPDPMRSMSSPAARAGSAPRAESNLLDETDVVVEDGTLKIMPKKRKGIRFNWHDGKAVFTVNAAALHGAAIAGSGGVNVDKVAGDFEGDVAGSGDLKLGLGRRRQDQARHRRVGRRRRGGQGRQRRPVDRRIGRHPRRRARQPHRRRVDRRIGQCRRQRQRERRRFDHGIGRRRDQRRRQVQRVQGRIGQRPLQLSRF